MENNKLSETSKIKLAAYREAVARRQALVEKQQVQLAKDLLNFESSLIAKDAEDEFFKMSIATVKKDESISKDKSKWLLADHGIHAIFVKESGKHPLRIKPINRPLLAAVYKEDPSAVRFALENGADPDACFDTKQRCLHRALRSGENGLDIVKILLEFGANPNLATTNRHTPLTLAMLRVDMIDHVEALLAHGANPFGAYPRHYRNSYNPLDFCADSSQLASQSVLESFMDSGPSQESLDEALYHLVSGAKGAKGTKALEISKTKTLIKAGANPYQENDHFGWKQTPYQNARENKPWLVDVIATLAPKPNPSSKRKLIS